jgi:hypothetical protein
MSGAFGWIVRPSEQEGKLDRHLYPRIIDCFQSEHFSTPPLETVQHGVLCRAVVNLLLRPHRIL